MRLTQTEKMIRTERLRREAERRRQEEARRREYARGRASAAAMSETMSRVPSSMVQNFLEEARSAYGREIARELSRGGLHGPTVTAARIVLETFMREFSYAAGPPEDSMRLIMMHELDGDGVRLSVHIPEKRFNSILPRRVLRDAAF